MAATNALIDCLLPEWPAPPNVRALTSLRGGGVSVGAYKGFNLGSHVGDAPEAVAHNRTLLKTFFDLPTEPCWLDQVHGNRVVSCSAGAVPGPADGAYTNSKALVCAVLTADCLPVLFCNRKGTRVAAAHAGWRGLAAGVLESAVAAFNDSPNDLLAWLGPAIGPKSFEVGPEVREAFVQDDIRAGACFVPGPADRHLADIYALARLRLERAGVISVFGGGWDTFEDADRFYSYRRDGRAGRMASLIWLI